MIFFIIIIWLIAMVGVLTFFKNIKTEDFVDGDFEKYKDEEQKEIK